MTPPTDQGPHAPRAGEFFGFACSKIPKSFKIFAKESRAARARMNFEIGELIGASAAYNRKGEDLAKMTCSRTDFLDRDGR
jgi:hypothetical protein